MDPELQCRFRRLFRFYDVQGDGVPNLPLTDRRISWQLQRSQLQLWRRFARLHRSCQSQALLIGTFGLVGLISILTVPPIGRLVDRFGSDRIVLVGVFTIGAGVLLLGLGSQALPALVLGLMVVELGVQGCCVANQTPISALNAAARSRMVGQLFLTAYLGAALYPAVIARFWAPWGWVDSFRLRPGSGGARSASGDPTPQSGIAAAGIRSAGRGWRLRGVR